MQLTYYCDTQRHLVCLPYSVDNLHKMAKDLGINKCWFHKDHYDIPKKSLMQIFIIATLVRPRTILTIIHSNQN